MNTPDHSTKFIHYRPFEPSSGMCIGFRWDRQTNEADVSIFIPDGVYNKRVARLACIGRLNKQKKIEVKVDPLHVCESIIRAAVGFVTTRGMKE